MIFKKIAAAITASVMAVTSLASFASAERNYPYTATLGFADSTWEAMDWETSIEITGNGTYTITTDSDIWLENSYSWDDEDEVKANGINVFVIDIKGLGSDLDPTDEGNVEELCTFSDVKVTADGVDIPVDQSKLVWGDLESKGDVRLEIYNAYGETKNDPPINPDDIIDVEEISVTFTLTITEPDKPSEPTEFEAGDCFFVKMNPVTGEAIGLPTINIDNVVNDTAAAYICKLLDDDTISICTYIVGENKFSRDLSITIPDTIGGYTVTEIGIVGGILIEYGNQTLSGGGIFGNNFSSITIPNTVRTINQSAFLDNYYLEEIKFDENSQLKLIDQWAFQDCRSLKSITIPASVETIAYGAFMNTDLVEVDFTDTYSLTTVSFAEGSKLKTLGEWAFQKQKALTSITLPEGLTTIGEGAFYSCTALQSITLPEGLTTIGDYAFQDCAALKSINIPANVETVGNYAFSLWYEAFDNTVPALTEINVSPDNKNFKSVDGVLYTKDGKTLVAYPVGRTDVKFADGVTAIQQGAFQGCDQITEVTVPDGITKLPVDAFAACINLKKATLPETLTEIGQFAFQYTSITDITIPESVTAIDSQAFEDSLLKNINGVEGSYAETFANENGYKFNGIPTANSENTFTDDSDDSAADIEVIAKPNVIPEEAIFSVRLEDSLTNDEQIAYNCFFTYNGEEYEPTDKVTVRIPIPVAMRDIADTLKVYHYQDGKYVAMEVTVEDGYLVFETDHFSIYVVTAKELDNEDGSESSTEAPTTSDNDGNPSTGAAAVTMVTVAAVIASAAVMVISKKRK